MAHLVDSVAQLADSVAQLADFVAHWAGSEVQFADSVAQMADFVAHLDGSVAQLDGSVAQLDGSVAQLACLVARFAADCIWYQWLGTCTEVGASLGGSTRQHPSWERQVPIVICSLSGQIVHQTFHPPHVGFVVDVMEVSQSMAGHGECRASHPGQGLEKLC